MDEVMSTESGDEVAALRAVVDDLRRQVADQERRLVEQDESIAALTGRGHGRVGTRPPGGAVSRRGLLGAAAGMAAATAVGALGGATPATAASGNNLVLGTYANTATTQTGIVVTGTPGYGFGCIDTSFGGSFATSQPAILGYASGQAANVGGWFQSDANEGTGVLVIGSAPGSIGMRVQSTAADGYGIIIDAFGQTTTGLSVDGNHTPGVTGISSAGGTGASLYGSYLALSATTESGGTHLRLSTNGNRPAPTGDAVAHQVGELIEDSDGNLWLCTNAGTPGTWRKLAGPTTAGALHLLPAPVRTYDSRPGMAPVTGTKSPLVANTPRLLNVTNNDTGVPYGAVGVLCNLLVVNAAAGNGNFTIWSNGRPRPAANTMVWGGTGGRFSSLAVTAIDLNATCQVVSSVKTDVVLDIVGYYL